MSLIGWLTGRQSPKVSQHSTVVKLVSTPVTHDAADSSLPRGNRAERSERREQLYSVVRHAMASAGVLSTSYKFKVLSLDSRGASFLVMMDLTSQASQDAQRMAEIEALIVQNANGRFEIVVFSVYWRLSNYDATAQSNRSNHISKSLTRVQPLPSKPTRNVEPIGSEEVLAFKNAFAAQGKGSPLFASGEIHRAGYRRAPSKTFSPLADRQEVGNRGSPLGPTQYGELN